MQEWRDHQDGSRRFAVASAGTALGRPCADLVDLIGSLDGAVAADGLEDGVHRDRFAEDLGDPHPPAEGVGVAGAGEDDDGDAGEGGILQLVFAKPVPVGARHQHVEHDHVDGWLLAQSLQPLGAVHGLPGVVSAQLEKPDQPRPRGIRVVDDEHGRHGAGCRAEYQNQVLPEPGPGEFSSWLKRRRRPPPRPDGTQAGKPPPCRRETAV